MVIVRDPIGFLFRFLRLCHAIQENLRARTM
jgi:hypothetical protein